jgi:hypothetical protein
MTDLQVKEVSSALFSASWLAELIKVNKVRRKQRIEEMSETS